MIDKTIETILYKPHLEIKKRYDSDGRFINNDSPTITSSFSNPLSDLLSQTETLQNNLIFIPSEINHATENILNLVHFLLILIDDQDLIDMNEQHYEVTTPVIKPPILKPDNTYLSDDTDNNTYPSGDTDSVHPSGDTDSVHPSGDTDSAAPSYEALFSGGHDYNEIINYKPTETIKLNRFYAQTTLDISTYYIERLTNTLASYHTELMLKPHLKQVLEILYDTPLTDNTGTSHNILQNLLKSQKERLSKMRLYQKLYSERESITLLKSLEYSKLTLLRMLNQAYLPTNAALLQQHKHYIENERERLNKKMFEYFRFLDSSLTLLETCLTMTLTEAVAKSELITLNEKELLNDDSAY